MKWFTVAGCLAVGFSLAALPVPFLVETPDIDGEFAADPGWRRAGEALSLQRLADGGSPERATSFRIGYGIDAIYLFIEAKDPHPEKLIAAGNNQGELWRDDSIEVFVTDRNGRGIQLIVNAAGARYNRAVNWSDCPDANRLWNWNALVQRSSDGYRMELRIPYLLLPEDMDYRKLYFNLGRNAQGEAPELSSFARLSRGMFFDPEQFVPLELIHSSGAESIPARLAADRLNAWRDDAPRRYREAQQKCDRDFRQYRDGYPEQATRIDALQQMTQRNSEEELELRRLTADALQKIEDINREQSSQIMDQLFQ